MLILLNHYGVFSTINRIKNRTFQSADKACEGLPTKMFLLFVLCNVFIPGCGGALVHAYSKHIDV